MGWQIMKRPANKSCTHCKQSAWRGAVDVVPVLDFGQGPIEYGRDVIEVQAANERDAIALGVREMLKLPADRFGNPYRYCKDARRHGENPYAGVFAELADNAVREAS